MLFTIVSAQPLASVAIIVTGNVPAVANKCVGFSELLVPPSPKFQVDETAAGLDVFVNVKLLPAQTLAAGEIGGVKLDKKTQSVLYSGLVQPNYPSISGKNTNLLGHLLEKYQFVEPNHGLIAEALWLLQDPDGYRTKIKEQGSKAAVEKTVRSLKTEESRKLSSSSTNTGAGEDRPSSGKTQKTISRQNTNIFRRTF
jgi:hypothetical protein